MTPLLNKLTHKSSKALIEVLDVWMKTRDMGFWDLRVNHRYSNWSRDEKPDYNLIKDSEFAWILKGCSTAGPVEYPPLLSSCCKAPIKTETNIKGKNFDVCSSCGLDPFPTPHDEQGKAIHSDEVHNKPKSANQIQHGGTHYKKCEIQPWDYIARNNIPYLEGSAIKYISRWRDKGGIEDLKKAIHFIEKVIELEQEKTQS